MDTKLLVPSHTLSYLYNYDVQQVKLHGGERNVSIQCVFASGSQARGCHMEIGNSSIQVNVTRSGSPLSDSAEQTVTGLTPGSYEVVIFDWERDGSLPPTPSYVGHVNVSETAVFSTSVPPTETTGRPLYKQIGCLNCKEVALVTHVLLWFANCIKTTSFFVSSSRIRRREGNNNLRKLRLCLFHTIDK